MTVRDREPPPTPCQFFRCVR